MKVNQEKVEKVLAEVKPATLVAATKYIEGEELEKLSQLGVTIFGENRVQAFLSKYETYQGTAKWHQIGTLQPNKVKYIIDKVVMIHAIDSLKLLKEVNKQATKHNLVMDVLIQVNIANEESKHGFKAEEVSEVIRQAQEFDHVAIRGLMMMAPHIDPPATEIYFEQTAALLKELQKQFPNLQLDQLSMGMSNDYHYALKHGATYIRIGRALFDQ